ncbi:uncharacterized protein LOC133812783 [Humulus lupulus]|uniref:uncharacterized protein LOC133812783 n=1 Tax=Humulus lupulus TaxID=3486 RepID=UPI002B401387|nr:uncharacterized protein LOC133812783 [Humulus lupulus]
MGLKTTEKWATNGMGSLALGRSEWAMREQLVLDLVLGQRGLMEHLDEELSNLLEILRRQGWMRAARSMRRGTVQWISSRRRPNNIGHRGNGEQYTKEDTRFGPTPEGRIGYGR